jgi:hypothetical protein
MSKPSHFVALAALLIGLTALAAKPTWTCYLDVSPLMGETSSSKSGTSLRTLGTSSSPSKTIKRNMRWRADVRVRGKGRPQKSELRVFYIAYHDDDMKPYIIKKEKHPLKLTAEGKDSIELTSPHDAPHQKTHPFLIFLPRRISLHPFIHIWRTHRRLHHPTRR